MNTVSKLYLIAEEGFIWGLPIMLNYPVRYEYRGE